MKIFRKRNFRCKCVTLFVVLSGFLPFFSQAQQLKMYDFVLFGGNGNCPSAPGQRAPVDPGCAVVLGSANNISGDGVLGSYTLIQSTGTNHIIGNLHSGGKIILAGNNVITGRVTAANASAFTGAILKAGDATNISGDILL